MIGQRSSRRESRGWFFFFLSRVVLGSSAYSLAVFLPISGQPCAACYDVDGLWYRAEVLACITPGQVKVCHVDYGTVVNVDVGRYGLCSWVSIYIKMHVC